MGKHLCHNQLATRPILSLCSAVLPGGSHMNFKSPRILNLASFSDGSLPLW